MTVCHPQREFTLRNKREQRFILKRWKRKEGEYSEAEGAVIKRRKDQIKV